MSDFNKIVHSSKGKVVSLSKDQKTAKIVINRVVESKLYGKRLNRRTVVLADTRKFLEVNGKESLAANSCVIIAPCAKKSKRKSWFILSMV